MLALECGFMKEKVISTFFAQKPVGLLRQTDNVCYQMHERIPISNERRNNK